MRDVPNGRLITVDAMVKRELFFNIRLPPVGGQTYMHGPPGDYWYGQIKQDEWIYYDLYVEAEAERMLPPGVYIPFCSILKLKCTYMEPDTLIYSYHTLRVARFACIYADIFVPYGLKARMRLPAVRQDEGPEKGWLLQELSVETTTPTEYNDEGTSVGLGILVREVHRAPDLPFSLETIGIPD